MAYCVTGGWTRVHWIWCTVEWTWFVENFWCNEVIEPPYLVCNDLFFSELHILFRRSCVRWVVRVWPLHWSPKWARKNEPLHAVFACFALFLFHRFGEIHSIRRDITEGYFLLIRSLLSLNLHNHSWFLAALLPTYNTYTHAQSLFFPFSALISGDSLLFPFFSLGWPYTFCSNESFRSFCRIVGLYIAQIHGAI